MKKILAFLLFTCLLIGCNKTVTSNKIAGKYSLDEKNLRELFINVAGSEEDSFLNKTILLLSIKNIDIHLTLNENQTCSLSLTVSPLMKKLVKKTKNLEKTIEGKYRVDGEYCYITLIDNTDEYKFYILENYSGLYIYTDELECTFNRVKE